jgi:hypothetical protein
MTGRDLLPIVAFGFAVCFMPTSLLAQTPTSGQISGQVLDSSKAAIPNTTVSATNSATGAVRTIQTNHQGYYTLADLPVGTYTVSAEHQGFQFQTQTNVILNVATTVRLDITLSVGTVSQRVVVTSQAPLINKTDASTSTVMDNQQVTELPINGNNHLLSRTAIANLMTRATRTTA